MNQLCYDLSQYHIENDGRYVHLKLTKQIKKTKNKFNTKSYISTKNELRFLHLQKSNTDMTTR